MTTSAHRRKVLSIVLGLLSLVLFAAFATLNAFDPKFLSPETTPLVFLYTGLSALAFLVFLGVLLTLVRNVLKLYDDQRSRVLGSRLRTRMLWGAVLVSLIPLASMFFFSYTLMNRAVERWFSQSMVDMRDDSTRMAVELQQYTAANARVEAESIASELPRLPAHEAKAGADRAALQRLLRAHEITLQGGFVLVYREGHAVAAFHVPRPGAAGVKVKPWIPATSSAEQPDEDVGNDESAARDDAEAISILDSSNEAIPDAILAAAERSDAPIYTSASVEAIKAGKLSQNGGEAKGANDFSLGLVNGTGRHGTPMKVVVGLPLPYGMSANIGRLREAADAYWRQMRGRHEVRAFYMVLLLMITSLALFASCWLALHLSKQVTRPIETLADAMESIAAGDYTQRVREGATEELGELVRSFNHMAEDLEGSRAAVEASTAALSDANGALSDANAALASRRGELETMLETIPNGVLTLNPEGRVVLANRALGEMLDPGGQRPFLGLALAEIFPGEALEPLDRLLRRSHRMGSATGEMEIDAGSGPLNLLVTVALLEAGGGRGHLGYVIVLENATELLRAQKQSAWKEVARRVAHEIKNPLTPISLSAEQIGRHIDRLEIALAEAGKSSASVATIRRCSEVISASVESMRGLVDQFAALAQFPTAQPRAADLNTIVDNSMALFAGRTQGVRLLTRLGEDLPLVLADPEAMKRALSNLVDNAMEAMSQSLHRELRVTTAVLPGGMLEVTVSDTGTGLTDEMRERLFLPYFSTKQRGTGLGLAIAAKIIQEHGGTIRAEKNDPTGARFIVELKPASVVDERAELELTSAAG